jgi:hypothetical protein
MKRNETTRHEQNKYQLALDHEAVINMGGREGGGTKTTKPNTKTKTSARTRTKTRCEDQDDKVQRSIPRQGSWFVNTRTCPTLSRNRERDQDRNEHDTHTEHWETETFNLYLLSVFMTI